MTVEIDQSGKIEHTNKHTILALSGDKDYAILISGRVKRQLQESFRKLGKPQVFVFKVFAIGVYLLLKHYPYKLHRVVIDIEYCGHEDQIFEMIKVFATQDEVEIPEIVWKQIGKGVPADLLAGQVARKKRKADRVLTFEEISKFVLIRQIKKSRNA